MKFGVTFARLRQPMWAETAQLCDELGYESLWLPEHLVLPVQLSGSPHAGADHPPVPPSVPVYDVFVALGFLAARTSQIRLATNVYNIGLRHPFITARAVATLDIFSGGRVELGIGASWLAEEWAAVELDFATRGKRVDEAIEVCRRLWTEEVISHQGEHFRFGDVMFEPKPVQPNIPLVIGGDGPPAMRRVARLGDGWIPMNTPFDELAPKIERIRQLRTDAGRDPDFEVTFMGPVSDPGDVERYAQAGVTRLIVTPWQRSAEAADSLRAFAERFISG